MLSLRQAVARAAVSAPRSSFAPIASSAMRTLVASGHRHASTTSGGSPPLDTGEQAIYAKLQSAFSPARLEVQDVSGGCGSFYAIEISSAKFKGLGMVKQQKLVNEVLKDELKEIHGIQLKTIAEE